MVKIKIYNLNGQSVSAQEVSGKLFETEAKAVVIQQAVVAQQANSRPVVAHTKTKGEVRGGGIKPWKQKGTGRARAGSIRSPLWKGGGVIFGPRNTRNFKLKINKKVKIKALAMVLTEKAKNDKIILLENIELKEAKTKNLKSLISKLPCHDKRTLLSLAKKSENLLKAGQNIIKLNFCAAASLNIVDLMNNEFLLLDKAALKKIIETYQK